MISAQNIVAWGNVVPWAEQQQVEQDLIISRALVEIFSDDMLRDALRFRGGTTSNASTCPRPCSTSPWEAFSCAASAIKPILKLSEDPNVEMIETALDPLIEKLKIPRGTAYAIRRGRGRFIVEPVSLKD